MEWRRYTKSDHWHKDADVFPLMDDAALAELAEDIAEHGLQQPIHLYQGKVLDGRNRLRACVERNVSLTDKNFVQFHPNGFSSRQFVLTQNLHRRQLTVDQRAAIAAELVPYYQQEAKTRKGGRPRKGEKPSEKLPGVSGKSTELAAQRVGGVSEKYVRDVLKLNKKKRGTLKKILEGKITLRQAKKTVDAPFMSRYPLAEEFIAPPFSVLNTQSDDWQKRKQFWKAQGVDGGHTKQEGGATTYADSDDSAFARTSKFDPVLAEFVYQSFCPPHGTVLDPFAGEAIKGIVAAKKGFEYTGIDLNSEQISANQRLAEKLKVKPQWIQGDSIKLSTLLRGDKKFDLIFTSPPYYNLEQYSKRVQDGSAKKTYPEFMEWYKNIFRQAIQRLKPNRFLVVRFGRHPCARLLCKAAPVPWSR